MIVRQPKKNITNNKRGIIKVGLKHG